MLRSDLLGKGAFLSLFRSHRARRSGGSHLDRRLRARALAVEPLEPRELLSYGFFPEQAAPDLADPTLDHVPGELLVKFKADAPPAAIENVGRQLGAQTLESFANIGVAHWRLGQGISAEQGLAAISAPALRGLVEYAEPNYIVRAAELLLPNDPLRCDLWGMHNLGQTGGTPDADIDALEAWGATTGSSSVVVGVIDTGIDYNHQDLAANIWTNSAEIPNNGIDDDGNGYVDDVRGWDFVNNDNDPMDDNGHGTHVAGTIGALGNSTGVIGVSPTVTLMPLKFLDATGSGTTANAIAAINYAASFTVGSNNLVRITNNSWGGGQKSTALQDAIANSGALFVAAAGNSASSTKMYPAAYDLPNVISVAATDDKDQLASFSNYGSDWVDLGAPGVNILSTTPNNTYGVKSGTSMATPHVTGVAALLVAQTPGLSIPDVTEKILGSIDLESSLTGKTLTGGRLNARKAVGVLDELVEDPSIPPAAVGDLAAAAVTQTSVALSWTATGDDGTSGLAYLYDVRYLANEAITETDWGSATMAQREPMPHNAGTAETFTITGLSPGTTYYVGVKVADEVGNFSALSNVVCATTQGSPWVTETVDSLGGAGFTSALAYDPSGNPAIGYSEYYRDDVKFAHWNGTSWDTQTVDAGTNVDNGIDVAYDPSGNPSLTYGAAYRSGKLNFAHWTGGGWNIQVVEGKGANNYASSLVYDPSGKATISYRGADGLKFARQSGTGWDYQVVDPGAKANFSALAYDADGHPSIAYSDDLDNDGYFDTLKFAHWNGLSWDIKPLETGTRNYGIFASLAYDPTTGLPSVAHEAGGLIRFLRYDGTGWKLEVLQGGYGTSLVYDSTGSAFLSYYGSGGTLTVARRDPAGTWTTEIADTGIQGGQWRTCVKLDRNGQPSMSYSVWTTDWDLKFARRQQQTAQILINPIAGLVTYEDPSKPPATFTVVLDIQPTGDVCLTLSTSDPSEGKLLFDGGPVDTLTLTFNGANWSTPQTVTIVGQDDSDADGNVSYAIITALATSEDAANNGVNPPDVSVTNLDNEPAASSVVEDFEDGNIAEYKDVGEAANASVSTAARHDGVYGLEDRDNSGLGGWIYRDDAQVRVQQGDLISVWVKSSGSPTGRGYFGFGASAKGTYSLVMAPNTGQFLLNLNRNYGYKDLAAANQTWLADHWYRMEVSWGVGGKIEGRLYDSDGNTLLNTVTATNTLYTSGGIAFRSFQSTKYFDTVQRKPIAATSALRDAVLAAWLQYDEQLHSKPAPGKGLAMIPAVDLALMDLAS